MFRMTDVVKHLLIINVLLYLATWGLHLVNPNILMLYYPASEFFRPYQIVTHFFMHSNGLMHIFFNMFALVMFGSALEARWGPRRFLFFYLFCAFGAAALHTFASYIEISPLQSAAAAFRSDPSTDAFWAFFNKVSLKQFDKQFVDYINQLSALLDSGAPQAAAQASQLMGEVVQAKVNIPIVGASGAIFGLLLAFGMYFPNAELMLIFLPIPIKAKYFIPLLMLVELFFGVQHFSWDNIAHFAHLGGALAGFLLILYWRKVKGEY